MIQYWLEAAAMGLVSALVYWIFHWKFHSGRHPHWRVYLGFKGWLRWGWRARWNMVLLLVGVAAMNWLTMPKDLI